MCAFEPGAAHAGAELYLKFDQISVYVITDGQAKAKQFKPRDEILVNFEGVSGSALECMYVPGERSNYDFCLTAIPGETLFAIYEKFGARLLAANVQSFLGVIKYSKCVDLNGAPVRPASLIRYQWF